MCGHCRTIVVGAFVVGGLVGFLTSNLLLNKKYKAAYEEEAERTREAGKRVVKGLKEKLAKYEATEEEYRQRTEEYISDKGADDPWPDFMVQTVANVDHDAAEQFTEMESKKIPEGKIEEANSDKPRFLTEEEWNNVPKINVCDIYYSKDRNQWFTKATGDALDEKTILDALGADILKELYKRAGLMRKEMKTFYLVVLKGTGEHDEFWQIDIWRDIPHYNAE